MECLWKLSIKNLTTYVEHVIFPPPLLLVNLQACYFIMDPFPDVMNSCVVIMPVKVSALPCGSCSAKQRIALPRRLYSCVPHQCHPSNARCFPTLHSRSAPALGWQAILSGLLRQTLNLRLNQWHLLQQIGNTSQLAWLCSVSTRK